MLNMELPYGPAIPVLHIRIHIHPHIYKHPKELNMGTPTDTLITMVTAALFRLANVEAAGMSIR